MLHPKREPTQCAVPAGRGDTVQGFQGAWLGVHKRARGPNGEEAPQRQRRRRLLLVACGLSTLPELHATQCLAWQIYHCSLLMQHADVRIVCVYSTWVMLNTVTRRPVRIPEEMRVKLDAFTPKPLRCARNDQVALGNLVAARKGSQKHFVMKFAVPFLVLHDAWASIVCLLRCFCLCPPRNTCTSVRRPASTDGLLRESRTVFEASQAKQRLPELALPAEVRS